MRTPILAVKFGLSAALMPDRLPTSCLPARPTSPPLQARPGVPPAQANWRIIFRFDGADVDLVDYH
jgi:hypothetical protein